MAWSVTVRIINAFSFLVRFTTIVMRGFFWVLVVFFVVRFFVRWHLFLIDFVRWLNWFVWWLYHFVGRFLWLIYRGFMLTRW